MNHGTWEIDELRDGEWVKIGRAYRICNGNFKAENKCGRFSVIDLEGRERYRTTDRLEKAMDDA